MQQDVVQVAERMKTVIIVVTQGNVQHLVCVQMQTVK